MSKPSYTGAKAYFLVLEVKAFLVLALGCFVAIALYREAGHTPVIGAAVGSFLTFLGIVAVSQIGRATIQTAENTKRMVDMMTADRLPSGRSAHRMTSAQDERADQLVARR